LRKALTPVNNTQIADYEIREVVQGK